MYEVCDFAPLKRTERSVRSECIGRRVRDKEDTALTYSSEHVFELTDDKVDVADGVASPAINFSKSPLVLSVQRSAGSWLSRWNSSV